MGQAFIGYFSIASVASGVGLLDRNRMASRASGVLAAFLFMFMASQSCAAGVGVATGREPAQDRASGKFLQIAEESSIPVVPPEPALAGSAADDPVTEVQRLRGLIRKKRKRIEADRAKALKLVDETYRTKLAAIQPKDMFETETEYVARDAKEKSDVEIGKAKSTNAVNRKYDALLEKDVEPALQRVHALLSDTDVLPKDGIKFNLDKYNPEHEVFLGSFELASGLLKLEAMIFLPMKREEARTFWKGRQNLIGKVRLSLNVHSLDIELDEFWLEDIQTRNRTKERIAVVEFRRPSQKHLVDVREAPSEQELKAAEGFKASASALAARASKGTTSRSKAKGWLAEYNRLIGEAQSAFRKDPYVRALKPLDEINRYFDYYAAGAVATAASGLATYMTSFVPSEAFRASASALATHASKGTSSETKAKGWLVEYNRLIKEAKAVFAKDPHVQGLRDLQWGESESQAAGAVVTAAEKFGDLMASTKESPRELVAEPVVKVTASVFTPLNYLPYSGSFSADTLKLAGRLGREFSPDATDDNGWTDLHYAAALNLPGLAAALLDAGADPNAKLKSDRQPFSHGLKAMLAGFGLDAGKRLRLGRTPLHFAALFNADLVTAYLVTGGSVVDAKTKSNVTPLFYAAGQNARSVAALLIGQGADVSTKTVKGHTPLDYAIHRKASETKMLLQRHGAQCNKEC